jgi:hypothetical protein
MPPLSPFIMLISTSFTTLVKSLPSADSNAPPALAGKMAPNQGSR